MTPTRAVLESPYAGDVQKNIRYARACMADMLARGEAPMASHLLYTQPGVLDDRDPVERMIGMHAGFAWGETAELVVVYTDLGISGGMQDGMIRAAVNGIPIERRKLDGWTG